MADIEFNDLAEKGVIRDEAAYMLPPEVWTTAENMRSVDGAMQTMKGWEQIWGTPGVAPHFAFPVLSSAQSFWLYTSLTKGYVWDGTNHTNITRQSAGVDVNYGAVETRDWNATLLGGIPILNNGVDTPQYWGAYSTGTKLANLTNWPGGSASAKVIRAFGAYLVAINYTEGGANYPHMVKWSASVTAPGTLPSSWDETNAALDAGEYDLPDINAGILREAMQLGSKLFLYKDQSIWTMRYVGGRGIFAFDTFADTLGILAPRCVTVTGDGRKQVFATQDDIMIHDGNNPPTSILHKKMRKAVFSDIDTVNFANCFMFTDSENSEVLFCYPQSGQTNPTRALVYNYRNGAITEAGVSYRNAAAGRVEASSAETWADGTDLWDTDTGPWSTQERRKVILCDPDNTKFHKYNSSYTRNGASYSCTLQRVGLSMIGRKRSGEWIVDHEIMKFVDRMWPKLRGGPIRIRIGSQMVVDGPVTWGDYHTFDPATAVVADFIMGESPVVSGRAMAIEFSTATALDWKLDGFKLSVYSDGKF